MSDVPLEEELLRRFPGLTGELAKQPPPEPPAPEPPDPELEAMDQELQGSFPEALDLDVLLEVAKELNIGREGYVMSPTDELLRKMWQEHPGDTHQLWSRPKESEVTELELQLAEALKPPKVTPPSLDNLRFVSVPLPKREFWWYLLREDSSLPFGFRDSKGERLSEPPLVQQRKLPFFVSHISQILEKAPPYLNVVVYSTEPPPDVDMNTWEVRYIIFTTKNDLLDEIVLPSWLADNIQYRPLPFGQRLK